MSCKPKERSDTSNAVMGLTGCGMACIAILCLPGCVSPPTAERLEPIKVWTENVIQHQAKSSLENRRLVLAATKRGELAKLDQRHTQMRTELEHAGARRIEDCIDTVGAAAHNRRTESLGDVKKRIAFSEANRAVGKGNLRREVYYRQDLLNKLDTFAVERDDMFGVARARIRAAVAAAACAVASARQEAVASYGKDMRIAESQWQRQCRDKALKYERAQARLRKQIDELIASVAKWDVTDALGLRKRDIPSIDPVLPSGDNVEACFNGFVQGRSSRAAERAAATIGKVFDAALNHIHTVQCLPQDYQSQKNAASMYESTGDLCLGFDDGCSGSDDPTRADCGPCASGADGNGCHMPSGPADKEPAHGG